MRVQSAAPELHASCAIAFGEHVLAQCLDGLAGDDTPADRRLDRDMEEPALAQGAALRNGVFKRAQRD
jgi:hypothetical protein